MKCDRCGGITIPATGARASEFWRWCDNCQNYACPIQYHQYPGVKLEYDKQSRSASAYLHDMIDNMPEKQKKRVERYIKRWKNIYAFQQTLYEKFPPYRWYIDKTW